VWKTSYRLVLDDKKAPFLQGWAIVENTTEQDWKDVDLTLISGRPISFVMDLYQPLFVARPVVVPELFASLTPQTYDPHMVASNVGELFQYKIETPVSLSRHESAMLPIVNASVKGQKISIFNPNVQAKYPLNGFKLINETDYHLMQGPITVFDGEAYAGDAEI